MSLKIGTLIDSRYRITARIGHGGMAEVYEANDIVNRKIVALKVIKEDIMLNRVNLTRFNNEALIAASLNHPNIVKVYNHGLIGDTPYIAYEYIKGQTLKEVIDFRGNLPFKEAVDYMIQLTDALYFAHQRNIIHRDVKPENIYVMSDGTIKLGDFGIAQAQGLENSLTKTNEIIGSVHYLAPELASGKIATERSDIYAAGVTFYEMLTAHPPYEKENAVNIAVAHINEKFPPVRKYVPDCPRAIENIVAKATMKLPSDRYKSAKEFYDDLIELKNHPDLLKEKKGFFRRFFGFK